MLLSLNQISVIQIIYINMMTQSRNQQKQKERDRTTLPPLSYKRHSNAESLANALSTIKLMKSKFENEMTITEPSENQQQFQLSYLRNNFKSNGSIVSQNNPENKEIYKCQMLSRGEFIQNQVEETQNLQKLELSRFNFINGKYQLSHIFGTYSKNAKSNVLKRKKIGSIIERKSKLKTQLDEKPLKKYRYDEKSDNQQSHANEQSIDEENIIFNQDLWIQCKDKLEEIPKTTEERTETNLNLALEALQKVNPFFAKMKKAVGICLLKANKIVHKKSLATVYSGNEQKNYFYIILIGKVKLCGLNGLKRICKAGETILQEILYYGNDEPKLSCENGKALTDCYLLQVALTQYKLIKGELARCGFRQALNELQNTIKRNNIVKNWMRNRQKIINSNSKK